MEPREMLEHLGVLEEGSDLWMVGTVRLNEGDKSQKARLASIRYFSYSDGTFYVCRSVGPDTLAIESQFYRDDVDLFKVSNTLFSFFKAPTVTLMVESNVFKFDISHNTKALKKIAKKMNEKAILSM